MKNLKNLIFFLFIITQAGLAQTNTIPSETNIPAQTEALSNNKIITPAELLAKYKITDIKTASLEQLEAALTEVRVIIKNLLPRDQASKDSLIPLRIDLKIAIENIEQQAQVNATIQQLRLENEKLDKSNNQVKEELAALDKSNNQVKEELAALDKSNNQGKQELAALDKSNNQGKQELAALKKELEVTKKVVKILTIKP